MVETVPLACRVLGATRAIGGSPGSAFPGLTIQRSGPTDRAPQIAPQSLAVSLRTRLPRPYAVVLPFVALLGACAAPRVETVALGASLLPNAGLEASVAGPLSFGERREGVRASSADSGAAAADSSAPDGWLYEWEVNATQQFLDDEFLADDGAPAAGDWSQAGVSVRAIMNPGDRTRWILRGGLQWFRARGEPNIVDEPGDYFGVRLGLAFETPLTERVSMGPELAVMPSYGGDRDEFRLVPQITWALRYSL